MKYGRLMGEPPPFESAVEAVQGHLSLKALKDTYLFEIKYVGYDSKTPSDVATAAAALFLEYMAELNRGDSQASVEFIQERVTASERALLDARRRYQEFKEQNSTIAFTEETSEEVKLIAALENELEKTEVKLAGLLKEFTPEHPKVQPVQAQRGRLLSAIRARSQKVKDLPEKERQLASLKLNVQVAEDVYQILKKEYEEAMVKSRKEISEIKVVSPAVPPVHPMKPIRALYVIVAFALSLFFGVGFVCLLEYLNPKIGSIEDVRTVLGLPVLATLPQTNLSWRNQ
jgi:tyrosine-protein kinase Etk/Wzc